MLRATPSARSFYTTSSCGVCGKGALEEVAVLCVSGRLSFELVQKPRTAA